MKFSSPVYNIISVPIEKIEPNTYNPNSVAPPELKLLYDSIKEDGYTMPIVCYYDSEKDLYIIVDGFHRYRIMWTIRIFTNGKAANCRYLSSIAHRLPDGKHDQA